MSNTVYLVVEDMSATINEGIITLFNERHIGLGALESGDTYQEMRDLKIELSPIKGSGYDKFKNEAPFWVLPFYAAVDMEETDGALVLTVDELNNFGWDLDQEIE